MGRRPVDEIGDSVHYIRTKQLDVRYRVFARAFARWCQQMTPMFCFSFSVSAPTSAGEIFGIGADLVGKCEQMCGADESSR